MIRSVAPRSSTFYAFLIRKIGNRNLNRGIPWLQNTDGAICFICKEDIGSVTHFLLDCSYFRNSFESLWNKLKLKIAQSNQTDGIQGDSAFRKCVFRKQETDTFEKSHFLRQH